MKTSLLAALIVGIALSVFWLAGKRNSPPTATQVKQSAISSGITTAPAASFPKQQKTFNEVEVEVVPRQLERKKPAVFLLSLNTHSQNLGYDFTTIAVLKDNTGTTYQPLSWTGGQGGHHLQGELTFPPLNEMATEVRLLITGIDGENGEFPWAL